MAFFEEKSVDSWLKSAIFLDFALLISKQY